MKPCIIFCAAGFDGLLSPIPKNSLVIAADGGLRHTQALGLTPDIILGDFDSLGYIPTGSRVYPVEKDDTDAMLAVRVGLEQGCGNFLFYGAMDGPRLDHTIANFQTLAFLSTHGARGWLIGRDYIATVLSAESIDFSGEASGIFSLFCLGASAEVSIEGLHYPLSRGRLTPDFPLGVSNHFVGTPARITVHEGLVLALWDRKNGLGVREC
jgi:thiamine pyrophosphokinase